MVKILRLVIWKICSTFLDVSSNVILGMGAALSVVWPKTKYIRWLVLARVGMRKVEVGATDKAKRLAGELLSLSDIYKHDFAYGDAIHKGNLILGRIALRENNIELAKQHLLYAGETPGSPVLNSFGPNMSLAKELLEAGEYNTVLEYLEFCGKFWETNFGKLEYWEQTIQSGEIPNFGANLRY